MFGDLMGKLQEAKQKVEETKVRLDSLTVEGTAGGGAVKVVVTGNREVKSIAIDEELLKEDKEELEEILMVAMNKALTAANKLNESEMQAAASGVMPGLSGMPGMPGM